MKKEIDWTTLLCVCSCAFFPCVCGKGGLAGWAAPFTSPKGDP